MASRITVGGANKVLKNIAVLTQAMSGEEAAKYARGAQWALQNASELITDEAKSNARSARVPADAISRPTIGNWRNSITSDVRFCVIETQKSLWKFTHTTGEGGISALISPVPVNGEPFGSILGRIASTRFSRNSGLL